MRHAIEEEEKVPVEQATNFQEVTVLRQGWALCFLQSRRVWWLPHHCWGRVAAVTVPWSQSQQATAVPSSLLSAGV